MEPKENKKKRWIIEALEFVNLTSSQLDEIAGYSLKAENIGTRFLIYDYNTEKMTLSLITLINGRVDGKMNNLTVLPSFADSLYHLSIGTVGLSTIYTGTNVFDEDDFERCNVTFEDYKNEVSQDFGFLFNNKVAEILADKVKSNTIN